MKVGFVLDDTLDTPDGVQQYVLALGTWLSGQGHEVHYLVGQTTRTDIDHVHSLSRNVKVKFNGNRMSMPLPVSRRRIARFLAKEAFDVLHVQMPYSPMMAHRVIMAAPAATAVVGTFHIAPNSAAVGYATRALAAWTHRSLRRFDRILSVSTAAQQFAHKTYGIDSQVLPNVVDVARFASAKPFARYADKPLIVFLGRLVPRKGCQVLLQAVEMLSAQDNSLDFRVVVCGRGPLEASLKQFVVAHDLGSTVSFAGFVTESDKARYLKSADLAVFPSSGGESFGIVLIEAMAASKPVVLAADNPGYAAVLGPFPDGLFPVREPADLAQKMQAYLTDAERRRKILNWQAGYVPKFDTALVGSQLLACYGDAVKNRTGRHNNSMRQ
jgi:phosphatidylinositol alpha-mannosyltransferase